MPGANESIAVPFSGSRTASFGLIALGVVLSGTFSGILWSWQDQERQRDFQRVAHERAQAFRKSVESSLEALENVCALYRTLGATDWQSFRSFVRPILATHPSMSALEWVPRIPRADLETFEREVRGLGHPDFRVYERGPQGNHVAVGLRSEYFPVYYVEPLEKNRTALGFDLGSNPARLETLNRARNLGVTAATGRIQLVQDVQKGDYGFVGFCPVRNDLTEREHWNRREGLIVGVFNIGEILRQSLPQTYLEGSEDLEMHLFDGSAPEAEARLYPGTRTERTTAQVEGTPRLIETIDVLGRQWQVLYVPRAGGRWRSWLWAPWLALFGGLFLTLLLRSYVHTTSRRAVETERLVGERTLELSLANQALRIENTERTRLEQELRDSYRAVEETVALRTRQLELRNRLLRETFGLFMDDEVVAQLLEAPESAKLGGERRRISVLTCDLRGFSALSERLDPEQLLLYLNRYFETMVTIILQYRGTIADFVGDSILVLFGAPIADRDDALRACACAIAMQMAMRSLNEQNEAAALPEVEMGVGICTGEAVVGYVGSSRRRKYAAVGTIVNLASRIESFTTGGQVLIDEATLQVAGTSLELGRHIERHPKGFERSLVMHELVAVGALRVPSDWPELVPPVAPLSANCVVLEGKGLGALRFKARIVGLSRKGAELEHEQPVDPFVDLKLELMVPESQGVGALLGKVIAVDAAAHRSTLRFTSLTSEATALLLRLAGAQSKT